MRMDECVCVCVKSSKNLTTQNLFKQLLLSFQHIKSCMSMRCTSVGHPINSQKGSHIYVCLRVSYQFKRVKLKSVPEMAGYGHI